MLEERTGDVFTDFVRRVEPELKRALVAAFGRELGLEATSESLAVAWERWEQIAVMENPAGYLWTVGRNRARRLARSRPVYPDVPAHHEPWIEPGLPAAIAKLTESQRTAVILIHGYGWTLADTARVLSISIPTVQKHAERGMKKLRRTLGVSS